MERQDLREQDISEREKIIEFRNKNAELTTKQVDEKIRKTIEKKNLEKLQKEELKPERKKFSALEIVVVVLLLLSGFLVAALLCVINGKNFGIYLWPIIVCVDVFAFTTAGFFLTEDMQEVMYGACSILSVICFMVQLAILF